MHSRPRLISTGQPIIIITIYLASLLFYYCISVFYTHFLFYNISIVHLLSFVRTLSVSFILNVMALYTDACDITPIGHCNGKAFNFREHLCCGDQLYPRVTGTECCCSYKMLDTAKEKCCHGFVIPIEEKCLPDPIKRGR